MERKFKSKLVPVKASEIRKQANVQLKESIELSKFRQVDPIDYDSYIEKNFSTLRKDVCSKQLIFIPSDDLVANFLTDDSLENSEKSHESVNTNLFVQDCLNTYENHRYEISCKYHSYGGNYRQLPGYTENPVNSSLTELGYEVDLDDVSAFDRIRSGSVRSRKIRSSLLPYREKNGWLQYKVITHQSEKNLKKRYFHLRRIDSPISSRFHSIEPRYRKINSEIQESNQIYVLEYFKEVPGTKRYEMPKNHIMFDANITSIRNTFNKHGPYSFEINEIDPTCQQNIQHIFITESQSKFDEWYNILKEIIQIQYPTLIESPEIKSASMVKSSTNLGVSTHEKLNTSSPTSLLSTSSSGSSIATPINGVNSTSSQSKFDLNKYLNEDDEDLLDKKESNEENGLYTDLINPFDLYCKSESNDLVDEETELECEWPEHEIGRNLILDFEDFKLNFNLPLRTESITTKSSLFKDSKSGSIPLDMNPELFYISFALFDVRNNQKISENFCCIPNYEIFYNQLKNSKSASKLSKNKLTEVNCPSTSSSTLFSLDGKNFETIQSLINNSHNLMKRNSLYSVRKALFKITDVHEEIFLVARIEKCLDGASLHSSVQPYLTQIQNENNRIKSAIKLHKKNQQIIKTKLANYRQPFAWAARKIYRKVSLKENGHQVLSYELDKDSKFSVFQQDVQNLCDESLLRYLNDLQNSKEKTLSKLIEISNADLKVVLNDTSLDNLKTTLENHIIGSSYTSTNHSSFNKYEAFVKIDHFEPVLGSLNTGNFLTLPQQHSPNKNSLTNNSSTNNNNHNNNNNNSSNLQDNLEALAVMLSSDSVRSPDKLQLLKKAQAFQTNDKFRSFMYVYPKILKYDQQKVFSKARNILVKTEFKERDVIGEDAVNNLSCIFDLNKSLAQNNDSTSLLTSTYYTPIIHHNKTPQFYDEIKVLLPLNLSERHHLLFKFYHVSCSSAKSTSITSPTKATTNSENLDNLDIENLIGYSWVPIFKNGRLIGGEKNLPVAYHLSNNYLSPDAEIKWIENMKPLFRISLAFQSSVHTTDPHVANFYNQCEKLVSRIDENKNETDCDNFSVKRKTPVLSELQNKIVSPALLESMTESATKSEITIVLNDPNKEVLNNSIKALHATDLSTIIRYFPTLLNRILKILVSSSNDASIHAVRTILHFVWQMTSVGKLAYLKGFIKYIFYIDYSSHIKSASKTETVLESTIHHELIENLVVLLRQIIPLQDINQMNLIFKNCWFFLEIILKSICLYSIQFKLLAGSKYSVCIFDEDFYNSLQSFFDLIVESIVKYAPLIITIFSKDPDINDSFKSCNRSLAMFIKKSMNVLNKKFLFNLINKYLENFHSYDKQLFEYKFDFIRIICNHEHFIAFNLPTRKCLTNINDFTELKHEFILSDQFRQSHYLIGVLFSSVLYPSINETKDQRKVAISMLKNLICKHSYDDRYKNDKMKQSRIASLYLPIIDILIENINRLDINSPQQLPAPQTSMSGPQISSQASRFSHNASDSLTTSLNRQSSSITGASLTLSNSTIQNSSVYTTAVMNNFTSASASGSILNGRGEGQRNNEAYSVLGVIAGLSANSNTNQIETIVGPISDTDSLSSIDDSHFRGSLKSKNRISALINGSNLVVPANCNSSTTNSDVVTLNNSNSINQSALTNNETKSFIQTRKDKFESSEIKDLLISFIYVLKNLGHDLLLGLLVNYEESEFVEFLGLIELCLKTFRYRGKSNLQTLNAISKGVGLIKSPVGNSHRPVTRHSSDLTSRKYDLERNGNSYVNKELLKQQILIESNLCHQIGLIIMNILSLILIHQKEKLCENNGDNAITKRLIDIYFYLLESNQSNEIKLKTFASLRIIINKTPSIFLTGNSSLCANLCLKLLKCFNSQFQSVRTEACVVLYLLMRKNYEFTKQKSIGRVHSQTIISTSQLIGEMQLANNCQVLECLTVLNNLATNDKTYQSSCLSLEVQDLTKRIRNILQATSKMKNFQNDAEMLIDSQYSLAKSYGNSVELRRIWLDSMATIHVKEKNFSEAAHCYLHIAALVSQNLKHQGQYTLGCSVFKKITPNIELEEELDDNTKNIHSFTSSDQALDGFDLNQVKYTQTQLLDYLCKSADMLKLGERYDNLPSIFKLAVAIYETNRDYEHLQKMHQNIQRAYSYMAERDMQAREKPLGAYYRVCFYGQKFNDENNKVYIYKEPGNTKLFEITDRLRKIYQKQFGDPDSVEILRDSRKPSELNLDMTSKNYIQIIHVQAYFSKNEMPERVSFFERNNNLKKFYYETPYQMSSDQTGFDSDSKQTAFSSHQHADLLKLCKRKIILETSHWFPYVKKRILVMYEKTIDLNPLETAIDELEQKIEAFESILRKKDLTLLELYLQGAIIPQVHKGPLAYAEAFLEPNEHNGSYTKELKKDFKNVFKNLIDLYQKGIDLYGQLASKYKSVDEKTSTAKSLNSNSHIPSAKYVEMHCLLQEKFLEFENSFRNLLLVDGDFDLYQKQLNNRGGSKVSIGIAKSSSSQA